MSEARRKEVLRQAWQAGILAWKLRPYQVPVYDSVWKAILDADCRKYCLNISRRFGKSTTLNLVADEVARRIPGAQIRSSAPTGKELRNITIPLMKKHLVDCPDEYRPRWRAKDSMWVYPNGSEYHVAGANDGHADDQRGTQAHLALVDECGFVDDLEYLVDDVLMPQTLDTGGTLLISSTPPRSPAHPYCKMAIECQSEGHYVHRDIFAMNLDQRTLDSYARAAGGYGSTTWKREYLAQFVVDENLAIIPEWSDDFVLVRERHKDLWKFWHRYEALDTGVRDNTACLFAYYDFSKAHLHVEDEVIINGPKLTTPLLADEIRKKEELLEYNKGAGVYRRIGDNSNLQLLNDLSVHERLGFYPTDKSSLVAMVNQLRTFVGDKRVTVDPRCQNLIGCVKHGIWQSERHIGREFGRVGKYGHFDALAALVYLVRNLDVNTNPIPAGYGLDPLRQFVHKGLLDRGSDQARALREIYGLKSR